MHGCTQLTPIAAGAVFLVAGLARIGIAKHHISEPRSADLVAASTNALNGAQRGTPPDRCCSVTLVGTMLIARSAAGGGVAKPDQLVARIRLRRIARCEDTEFVGREDGHRDPAFALLGVAVQAHLQGVDHAPLLKTRLQLILVADGRLSPGQTVPTVSGRGGPVPVGDRRSLHPGDAIEPRRRHRGRVLLFRGSRADVPPVNRERVMRTLTFWLRLEFVLGVVNRFQKVAGFDRAIAPASGALTATIPLAILISAYATRFGVIGAVFAMISALFTVMVVLVGSAAAGREVSDELDRIRQDERPADDDVRRQWDQVTSVARSRWETLREQAHERRRRRCDGARKLVMSL